MPFTFIEKNLLLNETVIITGDEAHHLSRSLRLAVGNWIVLADSNGKIFKSIIIKMTSKEVEVKIEEELPPRPIDGRPALAIAIVKKKGIEKIIDNAVELGTNRIIPFVSERTVPKLKESQSKKILERWNSIALAAAKQSGLPFKPIVETPCSFKELCNKLSNFSSSVILYEGEKEQPLWNIEITKKPLLIIGPEGGFSENEITLAKSNGAISTTIGKQILRVETAAIAALSIWGQMRGGID